MFDTLDKVLESLLDDAKAPSTVREASVSFETPTQSFAAQLVEPNLNLFLYEVHENRVLRDGAPSIWPSSGSYQRRAPPLHLDCEFVVTAWSNKTSKDQVVDEHRLLGQCLLYLSHYPIIPAEHYEGTELMALLYKPDDQNHCAPITMVAQARPDGDLGQFWTALGIAPRPSFRLTVTLAVQVGAEQEKEIIPPVKELAVITTSLQTPRWMGFVVDANGDPIAGAVLTIKETTSSTISDQLGRYEFSAIQPGQYTMIGRADGFEEREKTVKFRPDAQVHNIVIKRSQ